MSGPRLSSFFIMVAFGLAALAAFSATPGDEEDVRAFVKAFAASLQSPDDPEGVLSFYSADASHIGTDGQRVSGTIALTRYFGARGAQKTPPAAEIAHARVSFLSERVALVDGSLRAGSTERFVLVVRETSDGWKIVASRLTPEPPAADD